MTHYVFSMAKYLLLMPLLACCASSSAAFARIENDKTIVLLFSKACLEGELSWLGRKNAIVADRAWVQSETSELLPQQASIVPSIEPVGGIIEPIAVMEWTRTIDGKLVRLMLGEYTAKNRYRTMCMMVVRDVPNALPFLDGFRAAVKALGIKGKSTDIPHYAEFSGKLVDGRRARAEVFSRTRVVPEANAMHLYVAFADPVASVSR